MSREKQLATKSDQNRAVYIDMLRIVACLMVIYNHTDNRGFYRYINTDSSMLIWIWDTVWAISCKAAVPIFFMISGAMLLGKDESLKQTYKRIPRIVICLILFSVLYLCGGSLLSGDISSLLEAGKKIISTSYWHLWYLYAYIAFIISLPLLRRFVSGLEITDGIYMFVVGIVVLGILPIVDAFIIPVNWKITPAWISESIFMYPILGFIIDKKLDSTLVQKKHMYILWGLNLLSFGLSVICEKVYLQNAPGEINEIFISNFSVVNAVVVFCTAKYLLTNKQLKSSTHSAIIEVGKCTFGIYLLHIIILWKLPFIGEIWNCLEDGHHFGVYLSCILCFGITGIIVMVARKIPIIKRLF